MTGERAVSFSPTAARDRSADVVVLSTGDVRVRYPGRQSAVVRDVGQRYQEPQGLAALRSAVAGLAGPGLDPGQVLIAAGARQALLLIFAALVGSSRPRLVVPEPYWASYPALAESVGCEIIVARGPAGEFDVAALRQAAGPRTGAVVLNSPRNPDGAILRPGELAELVSWTKAAGLLLVFDQVYRGVPLPGPAAPSPLHLPGGLPEHCVVVDGLTKSHALAGLRIGWAIAAPGLVSRLTALSSHLVGGVCLGAQEIALAALAEGADGRASVGRVLAANRDDGVRRLAGIPGVRCGMPLGGIFLFPDLDGWLTDRGMAASDFVPWLEERHSVAAVPGSAFGMAGSVRLSYAVDEDVFQAGMDRLCAALAARRP
ncbi:MAG TPA: aminotransferase class I/II-fold pyridoxal phosphate-dependent enzyme [Streptosporangiaceae bacterium]|nr:aminotransferase class I/II-fold pyridoxal phosphate-dependent enzyme [Streptosporangiaceae bacterium]